MKKFGQRLLLVFRTLQIQIQAACEWARGGQSPGAMQDASRLQRFLRRNIRVFFLAARLEVIAKVQLHAQALTYATLLSIVPLVAVVFSIFKGFGTTHGIEDRVTDFFVHNVAGTPEQEAAFSGYIKTFVGNINAGQIGWVSILILVWSVLMLLDHIEASFNAVFGVSSQRPFVTRILTYWAVLTFGPMLLAGSFALTAGLQSTTFAAYVDRLGAVWALVVLSTPLLITWIAFTAMYLVVPNTRVRFSAAFMAAAVTGSAWNVWKFAYAWYARNNVTQHDIYGSLAVIPLFVLWLYVSWLLVLFGAQLAFAFQHAATYRREDERAEASQDYLELIACRIFFDVAQDFHFGRPPTNIEDLIAKHQIPRRILDRVETRLGRGGLIRHTEPDGALVPGTEITRVTIASVVSQVRSADGVDPDLRRDTESAFFDEIFGEVERQRLQLTGHTNFGEIIDQLITKSTPSQG